MLNWRYRIVLFVIYNDSGLETLAGFPDQEFVTMLAISRQTISKCIPQSFGGFLSTYVGMII